MDECELKRKALILEWESWKYIHPTQFMHDIYLLRYVGNCKAIDDSWEMVSVNRFMNTLLQEVMFSELRHVINALYETSLTGTSHMFRIDRMKGKW